MEKPLRLSTHASKGEVQTERVVPRLRCGKVLVSESHPSVWVSHRRENGKRLHLPPGKWLLWWTEFPFRGSQGPNYGVCSWWRQRPSPRRMFSPLSMKGLIGWVLSDFPQVGLLVFPAAVWGWVSCDRNEMPEIQPLSLCITCSFVKSLRSFKIVMFPKRIWILEVWL